MAELAAEKLPYKKLAPTLSKLGVTEKQVLETPIPENNPPLGATLTKKMAEDALPLIAQKKGDAKIANTVKCEVPDAKTIDKLFWAVRNWKESKLDTEVAPAE